MVGLAFASLTAIGFVVAPWLVVGDRDAIEEWWGEEKAERYDERSESEGPIETVKRRYAEGELSEAEFEHRLQGLLDADRRETTGSDPDESHTEREPVTELEDR